MLNSHLKLKINKSKDTLNVKLEPPVGVSKSLIRESLDWTESFKRLIHSGTKHVIAQSQRRKTVYGIIFVVEIEQKQAMCLKRKSLN